jgi:RNA polymerase sigma-70 factor (ECF subfamily)
VPFTNVFFDNFEKTMKEFGPLLGYSIEMEQKKSENPKGPRKPAALWMQILPAVSAYVRSIILNYHDSEDIIQNIAVIFAEKYDRLDPSRKVLPWILRIARYEVVNYFRSQGREQIIFDEKVLKRIERAYRVIHDESEDVKKALHTCIESLNDRPRHVLKLRYFREMGILDISQRLGLSSNAVYIILCRVREALANCVQKKTGVLWKVT